MSRWRNILLGLFLGLTAGLAYGWVISPVEYIDTTLDTLRADYRTDYVLMAAEAFQVEQDLALAARRLAALGSEQPGEIAIQALAFAQQSGYPEEDLALIQELAMALQTWQPDAVEISP
jgi:hypothetical protein